MKKIILLPVFSFYTLFSFGQNAKIDSLINVLKTAKPDTAKVNSLNELAFEFKSNHPDTAIYFAKQALELSKTMSYIFGIATSWARIGMAMSSLGKYDEALKSSYTALKLYDQIISSENTINIYKLLKYKASTYNTIGVIYLEQGNYLLALKNHSASLKIKNEIGDKIGIAGSFNNIGIVYDSQGNYPKALKNYLAALDIVEEIGDKPGISNSYNNIGNIYFYQGNYPEALKNYLTALKLREEINDKKGIATSYNNIGGIYGFQKNYKEALKNHFSSLKIREEIGDERGVAASYNNIGIIYMEQGSYSKALKNYFIALKINEGIGDKSSIAGSYSNIGGLYEIQGNYLEALKNYFLSLKIWEEMGEKLGIVNSYLNIGHNYIKLRKTNDASYYLNKGLTLAQEVGSSEDIKEFYGSLSELDSAQNNFKQAYIQYKMYIKYRDSLINEENTKKIIQTQMQYDFDKKEAATKAETDKKEALAKAEIAKQKIIRNSIAGGTGIIALSSIFIFIVYKRKREATFKNEVSEVEMKALRSQMNPHFIFNSLNSIKRYMANHDIKTAEDYLMKFASVMRMILENSEHKEVPLQQDLKALELYMQLEALRMKKKFYYEIKVDESIDQENTLIPPLILQPFVENSIWHGLAGKEGEGKISISINRVGEMIECIVEDNGVGREKAKTDNPEIVSTEKKSLGMKITNARIDILNKIKKSKAGVELVDLTEGMKVIVKLPLELSF